MAWSTPVTHAVGDILTASDWNISSNDIAFLGSASSQFILTTETTTSTSYTNLATTGPSVTVTTGANAIVIVTATAGNATGASSTFMGFAISGATTASAADFEAALWATQGANNMAMSAVFLATPLTPGSNTFTAKYRVTSGTGAYANRYLAVIPLP